MLRSKTQLLQFQRREFGHPTLRSTEPYCVSAKDRIIIAVSACIPKWTLYTKNYLHIFDRVDSRWQNKEDRRWRPRLFERLGELHTAALHVLAAHLLFNKQPRVGGMREQNFITKPISSTWTHQKYEDKLNNSPPISEGDQIRRHGICQLTETWCTKEEQWPVSSD